MRVRSAEHDGDPLVAQRGYLIGPHDGPVLNEPTGQTHAVGIVTTPVGAGPVLGIEPARVRGRVVDLPSVWRDADELRRLVDEGGLVHDGSEVLAGQVTGTHMVDGPGGLRPAASGLAAVKAAVWAAQHARAYEPWFAY